jgi:hypothetical protein
MNKRKLTAIAAAALCATAGAAAGISTSSAAKTSSKAKTRQAANAPDGMPGRGPGGHGFAVHATEVVLNKAGTAFVTETDDRGTITAVDASGGTITLKEGTEKLTYATPTITIPSGATVLLDGKTSSLEALKSGDDVSIRSSSEGTTVFATDSSFKPGEGGLDGHSWGGPPPGHAPSSGETPQA